MPTVTHRTGVRVSTVRGHVFNVPAGGKVFVPQDVLDAAVHVGCTVVGEAATPKAETVAPDTENEVQSSKPDTARGRGRITRV